MSEKPATGANLSDNFNEVQNISSFFWNISFLERVVVLGNVPVRLLFLKRGHANNKPSSWNSFLFIYLFFALSWEKLLGRL